MYKKKKQSLPIVLQNNFRDIFLVFFFLNYNKLKLEKVKS